MLLPRAASLLCASAFCLRALCLRSPSSPPRTRDRPQHAFVLGSWRTLCIVNMGSLGPLPAIDVSMDQKAPKEASRSAESQADLDSELDSLHRELGVKRGVPPRLLGHASVVVGLLLTCTV